MNKIMYIILLFFLIITFNFIVGSNIEAKSVKLGEKNYTVTTSKEYNSDTDVEWITIESDRKPNSRVSLEVDLSLVKDYNNTSGLISYKCIKTWLNNLEKAFDYFCELNLKPRENTLVIELTGVSKSIGGATTSSNNNRIVCNKTDHRGYLIDIQEAYDNGLYYIDGVILHEMGHVK